MTSHESKPRLTVRDLIDFLQRLDPEMEVIESRYSDYMPMELESWSVVKGVESPGQHWIMRHHPSISDAGKEYLYFAGN